MRNKTRTYTICSINVLQAFKRFSRAIIYKVGVCPEITDLFYPESDCFKLIKIDDINGFKKANTTVCMKLKCLVEIPV